MLSVRFKYCNPSLNIVFNNWNDVYLQGEVSVRLVPAYHRGLLVYRLPVTGKRLSYKKIKQGMLVKPTILQLEPLPVPDKIKWL